MFVLIEGLDATGKTTLSKELQQLNFQPFHGCKPRDTSVDAVNKAYRDDLCILKELKKSGTDVIFDRLYISNFVYQNIFEHNSGIDAKLRKEVRDIIDVIIYCKVNNKIIYNTLFQVSCKNRREDYLDTTLLSQAGDLFDKVISWESRNKLVLNYDRTKDEIKDIVTQIQEMKTYFGY